LSLQVGAWQVPPEQTPLWQSPSLPHDWPLPQAAQLPPQSASVSEPFWTLSLQEAPAHVPPRQRRL
jgi:hypothetical protein